MFERLRKRFSRSKKRKEIVKKTKSKDIKIEKSINNYKKRGKMAKKKVKKAAEKETKKEVLKFPGFELPKPLKLPKNVEGPLIESRDQVVRGVQLITETLTENMKKSRDNITNALIFPSETADEIRRNFTESAKNLFVALTNLVKDQKKK